MDKWIAETSFDCIDPSGKRFRTTARIGLPVTVPAEGDSAAYGRCGVSLLPIIPEKSVCGEDTFQAVCLAIDLVRKVLKTFVAQGGRVCLRESDTPIDLDDPSFCPYVNIEWLKRERKPPRQAARKR